MIQFARYLREAGLKIALSEISDALIGIRQFGVEDEHRFYQVIRATMLKDEATAIFSIWPTAFFRRKRQSSILPGAAGRKTPRRPGRNRSRRQRPGKAGMGAASTEFTRR